MRFASSITLLALLGAASAHFTLDYPYTRGFDEDKEPTAPCGGFSLNKTRTPFPLSGGFISYTSHHNQANSVAGVSFDADPSSLSDFNTTSSGTNYPLLLPTWTTTTPGSYCVHVNISSLGVPVTDGTNATIVMVFDGGDGNLHQCSDVTLLANYTIPSSISCTEAGPVTGGSTTQAPSSSTSSASSAPSSTTSKGAASSLVMGESSSFSLLGSVAMLGALAFGLVL